MDFFTDYNTPYLCALAIVFLIGLLEVISLLVGHTLSGALDAHIDHVDPLGSHDAISTVLSYLNVGRIPFLVILCLFLLLFSLLGIFGQGLAVTLLGSPLSNALTAPLAMAFSLPGVHYLGRWAEPWLPKDETAAVSEDSFVGCVAVITGHRATPGSPCEGKLTDKHGNTHYLAIEPDEGETFQRGDRVLIISRLNRTRFLAEAYPWADRI
ncbi:OB-fold-containig protein [Entomohabitans teleogrylli]|uniref:OB-fold-containig protein n=1 Tax=Entomohabitans teleogrylli TaxID=1384589 RepID=UPI00073D489A|nr:OB-fold-containig protein [Entomohabitans teleogrylli]